MVASAGSGVKTLAELGVIEPFRQAIGAEEKAITGLVSHGSDLRRDELVAGPERALEHVAPGMFARLALVEVALPQEPADVRVILGHLLDPGFARRQVVDAAVPDVAEIHPPRRAKPGSSR